MADSYGMSLILSLMLMPTEPPVAWKNEPCGRWSSTVAPALVIAAAQTAATPEARTVWENDAEAIVAPAVVDAVAKAVADEAVRLGLARV